MSDSRKEFEAWAPAILSKKLAKFAGNTYESNETECLWRTWQAATALMQSDIGLVKLTLEQKIKLLATADSFIEELQFKLDEANRIIEQQKAELSKYEHQQDAVQTTYMDKMRTDFESDGMAEIAPWLEWRSECLNYDLSDYGRFNKDKYKFGDLVDSLTACMYMWWGWQGAYLLQQLRIEKLKTAPQLYMSDSIFNPELATFVPFPSEATK